MIKRERENDKERKSGRVRELESESDGCPGRLHYN
jgi:hypothetical protein